ncbi:MAG: bifunctional helix-turn-helix transcriptional regulator/GNAT family N-acetyltransferase [Verrucomicrobia bacterium]|nr:bifunctional helix-turn-helix transcriptional regulator/GNAT family N-acetyltransferase [Verrucomicrobiota bacterium]
MRELGLLNDAYFEIGVTLAERHLLIELNTCQAPTMGEIAERLLLDKSTISRLVAKAVKKGYVTCFSDAHDKRKKFLSLSERGKSVLEAFEPIAFTQTREALLMLSQGQVETVYRGVSLYAEGLKRARLQDRQKADALPAKVESLPEITEQLLSHGYLLEVFDSKDETGLYEIFQEVVSSGSQFIIENASLEEFRKQFFTDHLYVCRSSSGDVVGGFYIKPNYSGRASHIANAAYMVRTSHRGKGLGALLVKASLHLAKGLGFEAMQFNMVLSENRIALRLYKKLGFTIVGTIPDAVRTLDGGHQEGYIMYRKLGESYE